MRLTGISECVRQSTLSCEGFGGVLDDGHSAIFVDTSRACRAVGPAVATVWAASFGGHSVRSGAGGRVAARSDSVMSRGTAQLAAVMPRLFAANANGQGVAAATAVRVLAGGGTVAVPVFQCGSTPLSCVHTPITVDAGPV